MATCVDANPGLAPRECEIGMLCTNDLPVTLGLLGCTGTIMEGGTEFNVWDGLEAGVTCCGTTVCTVLEAVTKVWVDSIVAAEKAEKVASAGQLPGRDTQAGTGLETTVKVPGLNMAGELVATKHFGLETLLEASTGTELETQPEASKGARLHEGKEA